MGNATVYIILSDTCCLLYLRINQNRENAEGLQKSRVAHIVAVCVAKREPKIPDSWLPVPLPT